MLFSINFRVISSHLVLCLFSRKLICIFSFSYIYVYTYLRSTRSEYMCIVAQLATTNSAIITLVYFHLSILLLSVWTLIITCTEKNTCPRHSTRAVLVRTDTGYYLDTCIQRLEGHGHWCFPFYVGVMHRYTGIWW